jgi:hypothetical protein
MKFGVATVFTGQGIGPAALAQALEERGFDSLFVTEHTHIPASRRTPYPAGGELPERYYRLFDPFLALTAAATVTRTLLLGTGVALIAQRDPIITAKEVATLDQLSNGRFLFGVGIGDKPIPAGKHQLRMEFAYDGGGLAKGGDVTLFYDGEPVCTGRVEQTQPMAFSADEACDVGSDTGSPASPDYGPTGNRFTGEIDWVQIDIGDDNHDHLITPEERLNLAMARQ